MSDGPTDAGLEIREVRPDEWDALGDVTLAAYTALPGAHLDNGYADELRDVGARAAGAEVLVAVTTVGDRRVVGGVTYVPGPGPYAELVEEGEAGFRHLAVAPDCEGSGVGRRLVEACIERARAAGRSRLVLHTTPWMTRAQELYQRLGFERAPELDWVPVPTVPLLGYALDLRR